MPSQVQWPIQSEAYALNWVLELMWWFGFLTSGSLPLQPDPFLKIHQNLSLLIIFPTKI